MQTKKLYQIYTEDKNRYSIEHYVGCEFSGFSVLPAAGFYKGLRENALIIEIVGDQNVDAEASELRFELEKVRRAALRIKDHNEQENVLITISTIKVEEV